MIPDETKSLTKTDNLIKGSESLLIEAKKFHDHSQDQIALSPDRLKKKSEAKPEPFCIKKYAQEKGGIHALNQEDFMKKLAEINEKNRAMYTKK